MIVAVFVDNDKLMAEPLFPAALKLSPIFLLTRRVNLTMRVSSLCQIMQHVAIHRPCLQLLKRTLCLDATVGRAERCLYREIQYQRPWPHAISKIHLRGAKSKTTVQQKDLPQGILESDSPAREFEDDGPAYPMMIQQARNNMRKFGECVLLTRVGGFYEVFEQGNCLSLC